MHLDDKKQIAYMVARINKLKQSAFRTPFTAMMILLVYSLWKDYRFSQAKMIEFIEKMNEYNSEYDEKDFDELGEKLFKYADWKVEYERFTVNDYQYARKSAFQQKLAQQLCDLDNETNDRSCRYLTYGFCSLIDLGFGKKKLTNYKDKVSKLMHSFSDEKSVLELHRELTEKAGIYIEKPIIN